ncbi:hypothetical protein AC628_34680 [Bradyrhizobium sp. NAS96.2]|nr:hypothetical protein AC628_34680 [Bradyrhizobium sp. NAS96.2]
MFADANGNEATKEPYRDDIQCTAVNLRNKFFRMTDDTVIAFNTININEAPIAIVELPNGAFRCVDLRLFTVDHPDMIEVLH